MNQDYAVEKALGMVEERGECCRNRAKKDTGKGYNHPLCHQISNGEPHFPPGCPHYVLNISTSFCFLFTCLEKCVWALVSKYSKHLAECPEQFLEQSRCLINL